MIDLLLGVRALAYRERLGKAQKVAGGHRAGDVSAFARPLQRSPKRLEECLVQLDVHCGRSTLLQVDRHFDPAPADAFLDQGAKPTLNRSERRRNAQLQVEELVIHRSNRDGDGGRLVVSRQGRKAGHALDHETEGTGPAAGACWAAGVSKIWRAYSLA
jgi:hypothetical protein